MTRLVVVGAGIEGCIAALRAKEIAPEASVQVISTAPERYEYETGTIDVLGYTAEKEGPVGLPLFEIRKLPEDHPCRLTGRHTVRQALGFFGDLLDEDETLPYVGSDSRNALVATPDGGVRPTSRYPAGMRGGLLSSRRDMRIVGFEQMTYLDAELVGDRLDAITPYDVTSTTVEFPLDPTASPPLREFAVALDENRETPDGTPVREALAETVRPVLDIEPRVGFPAMLGLTEHEEVRADLESLLQAEVFELSVGEPSLPGIRLRNRLFELLEDGGIERIDGSVVDFETDSGTIQTIAVEKTSREGGGTSREDGRTSPEEVTSDGSRTRIEGEAFILAAGGLAAGGLTARRGEITESVFDCHVSHPENPLEWSHPDPLGEHQFARFGVETTADFQPCGPDGEVLYDNLYAAGTVLGGYDFAREHSRGGVCLVTGYETGKDAVQSGE